MADAVLRNKQDIEDFARGCTLLGTGGGGNPEKGVALLTETMRQKGEIGWVNPDDVPDDDWTVSLFYMGSISPHDAQVKAQMKELSLERRIERELNKAYHELEAYTGITPRYVVACEMGGANTIVPVDAAYDLGIPVVDGDYGSGRANPEISNSLVAVCGQEVTPMVFCDYAGSVTIVKAAPSYKMAERIGKYVSWASFGLVGSAGYMLKGSDMKKTIKKGTLTFALKLGRAIREARESGADPVKAAAAFMNGWVLFKGAVTEKVWEDRDGYMYGHYCLDGLGEFAGQTFKVWFKNENHMTWLNGEKYVMSPDIISSLKLADGEPVTNTDVNEGQELALVGAVCDGPYRTPGGLAVMGPSHYGFDCPYVPIEKIMK